MKDEKVNILTGEYVSLSFEKAELAQRIGAVLLDWIVLFLFCMFLERMDRNVLPHKLVLVIASMVPFFNLFLEYITKGYTVGKKILGLRIISNECVPPTFLQCFMRWLIFPIDFFVGVVFIGYKGQRLGDLASGFQCISNLTKSQDKVDLDDEFKYINPNYKVKYPEAKNLKEQEIEIMTRVLYFSHYKTKKAEIARMLEQRLGIKSKTYSDTDFIKKVLNDYKYMNM